MLRSLYSRVDGVKAMERKKYLIDGKEIKTYQATEACSKCQGSCCRHMGCHYSPQDFDDLSFEGLKREIEKGRISIDWWESKNPEYYLRARHIFEPIVHGSWGGVCVNWNPEKGCELSWEERPLGGKALKPMKKGLVGKIVGSCKPSYTKEDSKNEWLKYSDILKALVEYFDGKW